MQVTLCLLFSLFFLLASSKRGTLHAYDYSMLDNYYDKHHNHCLQDSQITVYNY